MKHLKPREGKEPALSHKTRKWPSSNSNPGLSDCGTQVFGISVSIPTAIAKCGMFTTIKELIL